MFAIWILYSFLIAASYSGALKAFLTLPVYQPAINSLEDVLDSGLPWGMVSVTYVSTRELTSVSQVLYGEEEEEMMASSPEGSAIRRIWDEKIVKQWNIFRLSDNV